MRVIIQAIDMNITANFEAKIQRKLQLALSRVAPYIKTISIRLSGTTSATNCRLTLAMVSQADIVIDDTQVELECAIDRVIQKASRILERLFITL